jgi:chemotaxis family two-component system response regulator Rcp1
MNAATETRAIEILLVDDSPTDVRLTQEALQECNLINQLHVVDDGEEAVDFLRQRGRYADARRPDLILLDLNLPKKDGREVLAEIKADDRLRQIPVVVLTTSNNEKDILQADDLNCNCYITKPVDFERFLNIVKSIEHFWLAIVTLPPSET